MKTNCYLSAIVIILFAACNKSEEPIPMPSETKLIINGETFIPTTIDANKLGGKLIISFAKGSKEIELVTNDTITGDYTVVSQPLKSATTLKANITYTDGSTTYIGNTGTVTLLKNNAGVISGTYNGTVANSGTTIEIDSGSFADIALNMIPLIATEAAINDTLKSSYSDLDNYIALVYLFDAVYSNSIPAPNSSWTEIYNHSQTQQGNNAKILMLWSNAYDIIYQTNLIIKSSEIVITDLESQAIIIAQAKIIRAYLFYELMNWFGEIPLEAGFSQGMIPRNPVTEVLSKIKQDAADASLSLPSVLSSDDKFRIPKDFSKGLLARTFLYSRNYNEVLSPIHQIVNSGMYALSADINNFTSVSSEIIWGFDKISNTEFNAFFNKGSYIPVFRYTEVLLIYAEALFSRGNSADALNLINTLNARGGNPMTISLTKDELLKHWNTELANEGCMFLTLKRFDKALDIVQGYPHKVLLPVPIPFIISNVYLTQNLGY